MRKNKNSSWMKKTARPNRKKWFDLSIKRKGIGISNIINRIESYNGEAIIESSPGKGCKLEIRIPH